MARTSAAQARAAAQDAEKRVATSITEAGLGAVTNDSFVNFAQRLGLGADNPLSTSSYGFNPITRQRTLLEWIHRGSWIGGLAIDIVADDMTRKGIDYVTELGPEDQERIDQLMVTLNFWGSVADTIRWGRLYGGGVGVVLIDGQDPKEPLRPATVGQGQFKGIIALDRWMVEPSLSDLVDDLGPHLGMPRYYRVNSAAPALRGCTIHHTRVAYRLLGIPLPYQQALTENLWGISVLERVFDRMVAFDSASTGAAQLIYKAYLRTLKVKGLRDIVAAGGKPMEGLLRYTELMRRHQGQEGITLLDLEDEFNVQEHGAFSGLDSALMQFGQQLSGALQIPLVRLFGQSPSGLNSNGESDLRTYYDYLAHQQVKHLTHGTQLCYVLAAQSLGIDLPRGFRTSFAPLWELQASEKASVAGTVTTAVTSAKEQGLISDQIAMKELRQLSRSTGVFSNITQLDIMQADAQLGAPDASGLLGPDGLLPPGGDAGATPQGDMNGNGSQGAPQAPDIGEKRRVRIQPAAAQRGAGGGQADQGNGPQRPAQGPSSAGKAPAPVRRVTPPLG